MQDEDDTLISPLWDRTAMPIPDNKPTLVMIPLWLLQITGTCVTPSFLRTKTSSVIKFRKSQIRYDPLSVLVVQNTGYTQEKLTSANIKIQKMTERLESNKILEGTDD